MTSKMVIGAGARVHSPCLKCEQRFPGCHGTCGFYEMYRHELESANNKMSQDKTNDDVNNNNWSYAKRRKKG